jgi:hypothetical protein
LAFFGARASWIAVVRKKQKTISAAHGLAVALDFAFFGVRAS